MGNPANIWLLLNSVENGARDLFYYRSTVMNWCSKRSENEQKEDSAMSGYDRRASVYNRRASILTEPKDLSIGIGMLDPREIIANQRAMEAASNITDWLVKTKCWT